MPIEIKVAPPGITISQGRTFMVTNSGGEINPQTDEGVFAIDTRFVSYYHLFINRVPWVLVNSSQLSFYASRTYLTNPTLPEWFSEVVLRNLRVGPCMFTLHFWRERERSHWEVVNMTVDSGVAQEDVIQVMDELTLTTSRSS